MIIIVLSLFRLSRYPSCDLLSDQTFYLNLNHDLLFSPVLLSPQLTAA